MKHSGSKIRDMQVYAMGTAWRTLVFIRLETTDGLVGFGEASLTNREEGILGYLEGVKRKHVLGSDPFDIEDLWLRMWRNEFWRGGVIATTAMSAVEIACWDIVGKAAGQPVWRLLGGKCRDKIKAYANAWYTVERTPKEFGKRTKVVLDKGYQGLKVDPFGPGAYEMDHKETMLSVGIIEAIRGSVGPDVDIFVEGHGRFSVATAAEVARLIAPFRPGWFEEPVPPDNYDAMAEAARIITPLMPVAAGERCYTHWEARDLLEHGKINIAQFDVIHCGGILELKKMAAQADAHYIPVAPHNSQGPICTAASVHAGFTIPNLKVQECFDDFSESHVRDAVIGSPRPKNGYFELPQQPGLGVELDLDVIKRNPPRKVFFNIFDPAWHQRGFAGEEGKKAPLRSKGKR